MLEVLLKKGIVLAVICLFLLTCLSSVYAGSVLDRLGSKKVDISEPIETESHTDTCGESEIPYMYRDSYEIVDWREENVV